MSFYKCKNKDYVAGHYDGEREERLFKDTLDASIARDGVRLLTTVLSEKMEKGEWLLDDDRVTYMLQTINVLRRCVGLIDRNRNEEETRLLGKKKAHLDLLKNKTLDSLGTDKLLESMSLYARRKYDGHFTLFSFTTGYKAAFNTPDMDSGEGRQQVERLPSFPNLHDALVHALLSKEDFSGGFNDL